MARHSDSRSISQKCVVLMCLVAVHVAGKEICDETKCPGPLRYYKDIGCKPVYKNPGDCCAQVYDCSHLKNLSPEKCYANGHEYDVGESLKPEDAKPCEIGCTCILHDSVAHFSCAILDCNFNVDQDCYMRYSHDKCCPERICNKKRATCEVDGKLYLDGEHFLVKSDPELECYCLPGYKGENIEPFCKKRSDTSCDPVFRQPHDIHDNCVPVFYSSQNPQTDCNLSARCQNSKDAVIHNHDSLKSVSEEESKLCRFGNMTMHIGDELNQNTDYSSHCVKCLCEVPPVPTCQRLPDSECDSKNL
ncbi:PREDICTED: uncharacterized protein LOC108553804 [Eufriesea mexicana]|nr:PREDICTED: uncharacterized protein LOC108553804 [Eufriesea mexicana]